MENIFIKEKKFNARKEDVEGDDYLGIRIYRFYIKCTRCLQEISFKTDPKNTDYEIEAGATRNFMALKLAEEQAQREEDEEKEEEATNPMKLLEKRTLQSKQELELLESLEELKDLNRRQQTIDYDQMLEQFDTETAKQRTEKEQEEYDEECVKAIFGKKIVVEEEIVELDENETNEPPKKIMKKNKNKNENNISTIEQEKTKENQRIKPSEASLWSESISSSSNRKNLLGIVKRKTTTNLVKVNMNSSVTNTDKKEIQTVTSKETGISIEEHKTSENTHNSTNNSNNGLSLLGTYSGSSDNDSN